MNIYAAIAFADKPHHPSQEHGMHNTVCMDFDGVLNKASGPYMKDHFGQPIPEGMKLLTMLLARGVNVVIFTARKETDMVANWLKLHGYPNMFVTNHKIPALAYVDDRGVHWERGMTAEQAMAEIFKRPG